MITQVRSNNRGFTLIEMMVTVVIISILAAIAIPAYAHYILRGKLTEAPNTLATTRISMEQWYQDNKTYADSSGTNCGVSITAPAGSNFSYSCALTNSGAGYTWTATGANQVSGYAYSIDEQNTRKTTAVGTGARCSTSTTTWNTNC